MKHLIITMLLLMGSTTAIMAQTVVIDEEENFPVAFASVFNQDGKFLGQTDVDGFLPDLQNATSIRISHIAYDPKKVEVKKMGKEIKIKQVMFTIGEVAVEKPKSYCIRLTGFLRNYTLTNQIYDDDDPVYRFYEGTGELYIFLKKDKCDWVDIATRDGKTEEMVEKRKGAHLKISNKSLIEKIRLSEKTRLQDADGYQKIIRNDTVIGTVKNDNANHIIRSDIDYLFPDTVRTLNMAIIKLRVTEWKNNYVYRMGDEDYVSQGDLMAYQAYMRLWTKALGMLIKHDSFVELYVEKADFLTEDEYKATMKEAKARKKNKEDSAMTSEQLNQYMTDHNIPSVPEELEKALEISRQVQAAKEAKKKK